MKGKWRIEKYKKEKIYINKRGELEIRNRKKERK